MQNKGLVYAIAGLLHDIGKFGQRADVKLDESKYISPETKKLSGSICRTSQSGYPTHQHVLWTSQFIENHSQKFQNAGLLGENGINSMINLAAYHHKPASPEQAIITLADHWSSGLDRNTDKYLEPNPDYGKDKFKSVPLLSVFEKLSTDVNKNGLDTNWGYNLQKYGRGENIFPVPALEINNKEKYKSLWKEFENEFKNLPDGNTENFLYSLFHLLKIYTWYIPASTMDYPDNSLFEHLKTTGAFANCLSVYRDINPDAFDSVSGNRLAVKNGHFPVILFCGDISGIQSFIYNISNKSAMKGLKGRSFYVQLLAETLSAEILKLTGLSIINQVYAAGGKFYLLLPNTLEVISILEQYKKDLQLNLWEQHKGKLAVNMAWIPFTMHQVKENKFLSIQTAEEPDTYRDVGELWALLAKKTSDEKKKKFNHVIIENFNELFYASGIGGDIQVCAVSGDEISDKEKGVLKPEDVEQGLNAQSELIVSKNVKEQIELGKSLYNASYLTELMPGKDRGFNVGQQTQWAITQDTHNHSILKWINLDWEGDINLTPEKFTAHEDAGLGFRMYGGIRMATNNYEKRPKTLEELCIRDDQQHSTEDESNSDKLGILRLDVDNLGNLFMNGFKRVSNNGTETNAASFSSLATLSALFEQYFGGYLNTIRNNEKYEGNINIIYSGGDDVFAVGRWDKLTDFAIECRTKFREFVCGREDISISGGLAIVRPKFPIAKASDLAGELEEKAKNYEFKIDNAVLKKNAITLFGIELNWEREIPFVETCKNDLVAWIFYKKWISKGLLMKMFSYYQSYCENKEEWKWQSAYTISRLIKLAKDEDQIECLKTISKLLITGNYKNQYQPIRFDAFIAACRWAELEIKNLKS